MTVLEWMDIVYPLLAALLVAYIAAKVAFYTLVRRSDVVLADVVLLINMAAVVSLLALQTGESPPLNIDEYRYAVVVMRGLMCFVVIRCIIATSLSIWRFAVRRDAEILHDAD